MGVSHDISSMSSRRTFGESERESERRHPFTSLSEGANEKEREKRKVRVCVRQRESESE